MLPVPLASSRSLGPPATPRTIGRGADLSGRTVGLARLGPSGVDVGHVGGVGVGVGIMVLVASHAELRHPPLADTTDTFLASKLGGDDSIYKRHPAVNNLSRSLQQSASMTCTILFPLWRKAFAQIECRG